jgi:beclin 1
LGPAESFVLLNNSAVLPPSPTATSQRPTSPSSNAVDKPTKHALSTELLQLVSARTDTDHPLCAECARLLQEVLADKLDVVGLERDAYLAFERRIKDLPNGGRKSQDEMRELERRLEEVRPPLFALRSSSGSSPLTLRSTPQLNADEATAKQDLLTLEAESQALESELASLEAESAAVRARERAFLHSHALALSQAAELEVRAAAAAEAYGRDLRELERLEDANVWVDVFCIGSVDLRKEGGGGKIGSINGLRLGKGSKANPVRPLSLLLCSLKRWLTLRGGSRRSTGPRSTPPGGSLASACTRWRGRSATRSTGTRI